MRQSLIDHRFVFLPIALVLGLALTVACSRPTDTAEEAPLEPEDLPETVMIDPELDPRAAPRRAQLGGALPGGFPDDAPILLPADVMDFGDGEGGLAYVTLSTSTSSAQIRRDLADRLRVRGWQGVPAELSDAPHTVRKGGRELRVQVTRRSTGATYRYDYRPR